MRKHIFRSNIDKLISEGKDLLKEDVDMVLAYRISMVLFVLQGMPALQLAEFSDISGWYTWTTTAGFDCTLEYYLSRVTDFIIGVNLNITLSQGKGLEKVFFDTLGRNPLNLSISPQKEDWGRYV